MREVYVLVHEHYIDIAMMTQSPAAFKAFPASSEIERLRKSGVEIFPNERSPYDLPDGLPPPSGDLEVKVIGAYRTNCIRKQQDTLISAGYRAKIHEAGCVP